MALATIVLCSEQVQAVHVRDSQNVAFVEEEPLAEDAVEDGAATSTSGDLPTGAAAAEPEATSADTATSTADAEAKAENLAGERALTAQAAAANEKMAEKLADQEADQAGNTAARGVTKESAAIVALWTRLVQIICVFVKHVLPCSLVNLCTITPCRQWRAPAIYPWNMKPMQC